MFPARKCILEKIYCQAQLGWEKHWNIHVQDVPCPFHPALLKVPESSHHCLELRLRRERRVDRKGGGDGHYGEKGPWRFRGVFLPYPWNEIKIIFPHTTYLKPEPLLNFDLLKHNKNFSLKGGHKYLHTCNALAYNKSPLSSWNTIVFHTCEVLSGNYLLHLTPMEHFILTKCFTTTFIN